MEVIPLAGDTKRKSQPAVGRRLSRGRPRDLTCVSTLTLSGAYSEPARPAGRPGEGDWTIWQVDSFAEIAGIAGKVDLDIMRLDSNFEMDETPSPVTRAESGV